MANVDEEGERECTIHHPGPSCFHRRHADTVTSLPPLTRPILETMSRRIGRIGDWNNNSQSGSDGFVSQFHLLEATLNTEGHPRHGSGGRRIATLRDTTQPDPPARHHGSDDEDDEESGRDQGESWFAGGERRLAFITSSTSTISDPPHKVVYR